MVETGEEKTNDYKSELLKNGVIAFVPGGDSMWPTLKNRKQSVIVRKKKARLQPLDVALYQRQNGTNVLHRVMKVTEDGYVMCGDSQTTPEKVEESAVYGVMEGFYRGKTYISATDGSYCAKVKKWYGNERKRRRKIRRYFFLKKLKSLPKRILRKVFGGKRRENDRS